MAQILIADDDPMVVKLVEFKLAKRGHKITVAADGKTALDMARQNKPDLILLDSMMPGMDGFEVLRRLKKAVDTSDIPVVMLTARRREQDIVDELKLGAREYLVKPFMPEELSTRIEAILAASKDSKKIA